LICEKRKEIPGNRRLKKRSLKNMQRWKSLINEKKRNRLRRQGKGLLLRVLITCGLVSVTVVVQFPVMALLVTLLKGAVYQFTVQIAPILKLPRRVVNGLFMFIGLIQMGIRRTITRILKFRAITGAAY